MKIVYCIPGLYNPGGMERILTKKANFLAQKGYDITIITTEHTSELPFFSLFPQVKWINFPIHFNAHYQNNFVTKFFLHYEKLRRYKALLLDYLQHNPSDFCVSLIGKEIEFLDSLSDKSQKVAEVHFAKDFRKQFLLARKSGLLWKIIGDWRTHQLLQSTRNLSQVVVLTKEDEKAWKETHSNIIQIYNFCPIKPDQISTLSNKRFIAVGRLDTQKGFDYLIDIWCIVKKKHPDWTLSIYGQGEWKEMLQKKIEENSLKDQVFLHGVTNNVQKEYLASSGYLLTSRYEGFGMVLAEAMACGLPLVAYDCKSGPKELVRHGENGFLYPVADIENMASSIIHLIEDETLRVQFGIRSKEYSKDFEQENIMSKWMCLFEKLKKQQ